MQDDIDILEGQITVSKHRYGRIFRERDKFKKLYGIVAAIAIIFITLSIFFFSFSIIATTDNAQLIIKLQAAETKITELENLIISSGAEASNEIAQLRDRIAFLTLCNAIYEVDESLGYDREEEEEEIFDWREYVNLFTIGQKVPLPEGPTNTFRCMDYRTITDKTSWQHEIQSFSKSHSVSGLRYYEYNGEKYYTVALATAYGIDLGNAYRIELNNGVTFNIMHAEYKHDIRYPSPTDFGDVDENYDGEVTTSVIEFIYDWTAAPYGLIQDGEANRWLGEGCDIYGDSCNIKSMTYLGKIWNVN